MLLGHDEACSAVGKGHDKEMGSQLDASDDRIRLAEIRLRMPRRMPRRMNETRASGALATCASVTIFPFSPRTQIAVLASDTSNPIKTSMSLPFPAMELGRALRQDPVNTPSV